METWSEPGNFELHVESYGRDHLVQALQLALPPADSGLRATHTRVLRDPRGRPVLRVYWHDDGAMPPAHQLPFEMDLAAVTELVWAWLRTTDRGPEPDLDGSVEPTGFRVEVRPGGSCGGELVAVTALWTEFHK